MSTPRISARIARIFIAGTIGFLLCTVALISWLPLAAQNAEQKLRSALSTARNADAYTVDINYTQRQADLVAGRDDVLEVEIEALVQGKDNARFTFTIPFAQGLQSHEQEYLLANGLVYQREDEHWQRVDDLPAPPELAGGGLSLAEAAGNVTALPDLETDLGRYARVAFVLEAEDVLRVLLSQAGSLTPENLTLTRLSAPRIEGDGELWIDPAGLPARLILELNVQKAGEQMPISVHTVATYSGFDAPFAPGTFDPSASAITGIPRPDMQLERYAAPTAAALMSLLVLTSVMALIVYRRRRWVYRMVTAVILLGLLTPSLHSAVQAAQAQPEEFETTEPRGAELTQLFEETRALANQLQAGIGPSVELAEQLDFDFDEVPNGIELQLGTNPFVADTDQDGLTDFHEITGFPCGNDIWVETDPTNPDSNGDGVNDGAEFHRGQCHSSNSTIPNAWNDDNDADGVPDWLDLSPFTASEILAGENKVSPSFTFETLDQNAGAEIDPYPYYVDLQIRPFSNSSLQYAYKKLHWLYDKQGPIQAGFKDGPGAGASGEIRLVPFLEVQLECQDLPKDETMQEYGIQARALTDETCPQAAAPYAMQIPLLPVEEGGLVHAFQARVLHDNFTEKVGSQTLLMQRWEDVRLKWVVQADVALLNGEGVPEVSEDGYYGLVVYEDAFQITGLQVTRQGGVSMMAAANIPDPNFLHAVDTTDGPIALLRAGLEARFLGGNLTLAYFKSIFDDPSSADDVDRWGLAEKFRVRHDSSMVYEHIDEAVDDLATRVTPGLLSEIYGDLDSVEPTLILASEQRTSVVNLDELIISSFNQIVVNTCLNPLVTSRSLKLQKYEHTTGPLGQWQPLTVDQVLQRLDKTMTNDNGSSRGSSNVPSPGTIFSPQALIEAVARQNITKLATTAWFMGQTAIKSVGDKDIQGLDMDAADVAAALLDEDGLLPDSYTDVIAALLDVAEAGGPVAWLEQQWNLTVGIVQGVEDFVGSFLDWTPSLTMPSESTFLGWTNTAINVLNFMALVTGEKIFGQIANVLTTIIEIYHTVRVIIDTIVAAVSAAANGIGAVIDVIVQELANLAKPLGIVGMIFNIAITWISLAAVIGDLPPGLAAVAITKAVIDTVIMVVIFVLAAAIPVVGAFVGFIYGLAKAISEAVGEPLTPFDLTAQFFADLFAPDLEGSTYLVGENESEMKFLAIESQGGMVANRAFGFQIDTTATIQGRTQLMDDSSVAVQMGRWLYQDWDQVGTLLVGASDAVWGFSTTAQKYPKGPLIPIDPIPGIVDHVSQQQNHSRATFQINPYEPARNASVTMHMRLDVILAQLWDNEVYKQYLYCGDGCWTQGTTPKAPLPVMETPGPISLGPIKFDVIPDTLYGFWSWDELLNADIDGDGLWGLKMMKTGDLIGPDVDLCPGQTGIASIYDIDTDGDGLGDAFEDATPGLDPCQKDSDNDGLDDRKELRLGTDPAVADTDNDGRKDGEEVARWIATGLLAPWRVALKNMSGFFANNPAAYPNPRQANVDGDHRNDGEEWAKLSSPNARNIKDGDEYGYPITVSTLGAAAPNNNMVVPKVKTKNQ